MRGHFTEVNAAVNANAAPNATGNANARDPGAIALLRLVHFTGELKTECFFF